MKSKLELLKKNVPIYIEFEHTNETIHMLCSSYFDLATIK